jgi:transposase
MQGLQIYQPQLFYYIDIEKLVPQNHILRKIDKVFDLSFVRQLTQSFYCNSNGRPSVDPELFFRMILVGYIFGIEHDRKLCEEITCNLAYRWYCKLNLEDSVPDHSSLSRIRDRYGEKTFEVFFDKVVEICREKGLVKGKRIITDSTLIEADASLDSMVARDAVQDGGTTEPRQDMTAPFPTRKLTNKTHVSTTDPESTLARKEGTARKLKYKVHTSIDANSRVILDNKVTTGACHETQVYLDRLKYIESKYALSIKEAIADRGYGATENIQSLRDKNIKVFIPLFSSRSGQVLKMEEHGFIYNKEGDYYQCPEGKYLKRAGTYRNSTPYRSKAIECRRCPASMTCMAAKNRKREWRYIARSTNQDFFEEQLMYMKEPLFQSAMKERMWKIEGINAEAKNLHALKRAKYRGISKVQIQAYMTGAVQNLKRLVGATLQNILRTIYNLITKSLYYRLSLS